MVAHIWLVARMLRLLHPLHEDVLVALTALCLCEQMQRQADRTC
jgi:hypothetical protein